VTGLDWLIVAFALLMGFWGYQQGLIVGGLSLAGFAVGAFLGSRLGPALLPEGSHSPYAPATALAGALLIGGIVAVSLEEIALNVRRRLLGPRGRKRGVAIAESSGGALLLVALALAMAWLFGAVALNAPGAKGLRTAVQRSAILKALNSAFPPSSSLINALHRIDPRVAIQGPSPNVGAPDSKIAQDPDVRQAGESVVRVLGTACGLGVEGSGWVARAGVVVTNAHVVAGEDDTTVENRDGEAFDATVVHYDPRNDVAILSVPGLGQPALRLEANPRPGTPAAVLGYPGNGPFAAAAARIGRTGAVATQDSYGRGPIRREITPFRGTVISGDSGGAAVDADGRVATTVFAANEGGKPGGLGVPNAIVRAALAGPLHPTGSGQCS
jgi:S1-C subfamily serine protease